MADKRKSDRSSPGGGINAGWSVVGYLLAGIAGWGFIGWLIDRWLEPPMPFGLLIGMLVGFGGAVYLIVKKLGSQ